MIGSSYRMQTAALIRRLDDLLGGCDGSGLRAGDAGPGSGRERERRRMAPPSGARVEGQPRARNVVLHRAVAMLRQMLLDDEVRRRVRRRRARGLGNAPAAYVCTSMHACVFM